MTKDDLLNKFENLERNFILGFQSIAPLTLDTDIFFKHPIHIGDIKLDTTDIKSAITQKKNMELIIDEFSKSVIRTLIRESTEAITSYCNTSNQYNKIEFNDTFNFARIIRNSFAHNYIISFSKFYKTKILNERSIVWNGKEIKLDMEGISLEKTFFGYKDALTLLKDLKKMIQDEII